MAHVDIELSDLALKDREASVQQLREKFLALPGVAPNIGGFIFHRMDEVLSGVRSAIAIKIFGPDLAELRRIGEQVRGAIEPIAGVVDLQLEPQIPIRQVQIQYDRQAAASYGLSMAAISEVVETALNGRVVSQVPENQQLVDITVGLQETARNSLDAIRAIPLSIPTGEIIPLETVATVDYGLGTNVVNREDVSRLIVVSANVAERDLGSVVGDIQEQIRQNVQLPNGYFIQYGGQFESEQRATNSLLVYRHPGGDRDCHPDALFCQISSRHGCHHAQPASGSSRRHPFHLANRRRPLCGLPHWLHHSVRRRRPQRSAVGRQLQPQVCPGHASQRRRRPGLLGTGQRHSYDRPHLCSGHAAPGHRQRRRQRDPTAAGHRRFGWVVYFYCSDVTGDSGPVCQVWEVVSAPQGSPRQGLTSTST